MIITFYIILLVLLNYYEIKKLDKISNDNLFYILSLDVLSFSLYMFMYMYKNMGVSLVNILSILILLYFYIKEKRSNVKTTLFLFNIYLLIKILI